MDFSALFTQQLIQVGVGLISTLIGYAIHSGATYLKTKTKNEKIGNALYILDTMVTSAVKRTEQTFKKQLKTMNIGGKLTSNNKNDLLINVVSTVNSNLTESTKKEILKVVPDIREYIILKAEEAVHDLNALKSSSKNKTGKSSMQNFGLGK